MYPAVVGYFFLPLSSPTTHPPPAAKRKKSKNESNLFSAELHEKQADENPDNLTDTADDAHEDAEGGSETHHGDGDDETALLNAKLHGQETDKVGQQRGKRQDKYRVEEREGKA